jgi:predicted P-loop ATPase
VSTPREKITVLTGGKDDGSRKRKGSGGPGKNDPDHWTRRLVRNQYGKPLATPFNLTLILEHDEHLAGLFWLDEFGNSIRLDRVPPWSGGTRDEFTEVDALELAAWLGAPERYEITTGVNLVLQCVEAIARRRKRHTVREYLEGLQWDGVKRVERMFVELFGAEDTPYVTGAALCFMVSAVSRILWSDVTQPTKGSKVDFMVVLEGGQGAGKTTAVLELFTAGWYAEAMESPAHKDFYQTLRGRWVIEIGEMDSFTKADVSKVKQAITIRGDTYRPSYGRTARTFRRECVFVGTTNKDDYLRDETGARRFLPLKVGASVNIAQVIELRDQLWAEAVQLFRDGFKWWQLPAGAQREQDARYSEDVWTQRIMQWVQGKAGDKAYEHLSLSDRGKDGEPLEFTVAEVCTYALHLDSRGQDRATAMRVGTILQRAGCLKYRPMRFGERVWAYYFERGAPS